MIARMLRLFAAATAVAGIVGVIRHRRDTMRVRRGELAPASAAADVTPLRRAGRLTERLAQWVPSLPATVAGRLTARLWAAPMTAPGLAVALVSGSRPRWSSAHACWIAAGVRGPSAVALRGVGADANAIGTVVVSRLDPIPERLLAHEVVHVRQAERLGPLLLPAYLWLGAVYGYRDHPLERAARLGARRASRGDRPPGR